MMRWLIAAAFVLILAPDIARAAPIVTIDVSDEGVDAVLGETHYLDVTITNRSDRSTGPMLGHLVVVDPGAAGSADAEDWTDMITRQISAVEPGQSTIIEWDVTPISTGRFFVMVTVVPEDPALGPGVSSNSVFDVVASAESLQAIALPVAVLVPLVLAALAWYLSRRERRRIQRFAAGA